MAADDRDAPPEVAPVVIGAARYEAPALGGTVGVAQDGGVLAAYDAESGALLWTLVVYEPDEDDDEDGEVYITEMEASGDAALRVRNEYGEWFEVDLETREVTAL